MLDIPFPKAYLLNMEAELGGRLSEERLRAFSETRGLLAVMARELLELRAELKRAQADRDGHLEAFGRIKRYQLSAEAEVERLREALRSVIRYVPTDHLGLARAALQDPEEGSGG